MNTRGIFPVSILSTNMLSSATSTAVPTNYDMSNYFPVGRREVLFVVNIGFGTTTLGGTATLVIEESASSATTGFTSVLSVSGSTATWTTVANAVPTSTYFYGYVNYKFLRARYVGATSTGDYAILNVVALPIVRAG